MLVHYFKLVFRNLWKHKTQNLVAVLGLSVGILCFSICFYISRFVNDIDHCYPDKEFLAELSLWDEASGHYFSGSPVSLSEKVRFMQLPGIQACTAVAFPRKRSYSVIVSQDRQLPYELLTMESDEGYFDVFQMQLLAGNLEAVKHTPNAVVMTASTAVRLFGQIEKAIGREMILNGRLYSSPQSTPRNGGVGYQVVGVMPDIPLNNSLAFMKHIDLVTFNDSEGLFQFHKRDAMTGAVNYVRFDSKQEKAQVEQQLQQRIPTLTLYDSDYILRLNGLGYQLKDNNILGWTAGIVGTLVLMVGFIHFFHFLVGSFNNRKKEFSLLKLAGCNKKQLFGLFFLQSFMLLSFSILLVMWMLELLDGHLELNLDMVDVYFSIDVLTIYQHVLQYFGILTIISMLVCLVISSRVYAQSIRTGIHGQNRRIGKQMGRKWMLGIQFFVCWIFVALSVAFYLQADKTSNTIFNTLSVKEKEAIFSIPLYYEFMTEADKQLLIERVKQHAGVEDVLLTDINYLQGVSGNLLYTEKNNEDSWVEINLMAVPANFFSFMKIPITQGKPLESVGEMIIDENWQNSQKKDLLGQMYYMGEREFRVCGTSATFWTDVYNKGRGYAFVLSDFSNYLGHCYVKAHPQQVEEVKQWVEKVQREVLPESVEAKSNTLLDDIHEQQAIENYLKEVILFFALVCIFITLFGVYANITLDTERRQKEVAIRKVNGAGIRDINWLFARFYLTLLVVSATFAFPIIYLLLNMWKQMYIVFFNPGCLYWGGIVVMVAGFTLLTIIFRILKIARLNPAEIIKNE